MCKRCSIADALHHYADCSFYERMLCLPDSCGMEVFNVVLLNCDSSLCNSGALILASRKKRFQVRQMSSIETSLLTYAQSLSTRSIPQGCPKVSSLNVKKSAFRTRCETKPFNKSTPNFYNSTLRRAVIIERNVIRSNTISQS